MYSSLHPSYHHLNPGSSLGLSSEYRMPWLCLVLRGCVPSQEPCPVPFLLLSTWLTTARLKLHQIFSACWHCPTEQDRVQPSAPTLPSHCPLPCSPTPCSLCFPEHFAVPEISHVASRLHTPGHVVPGTGIITASCT